MADTRGASSSSRPPLGPSEPAAEEKPVVVRVKRKAFQERLDAFWLEINERPFKRALLDLGKLSISDSASGKDILEKSKTRKLLVQHVETISSSEATKDVLQSFLPYSIDSREINRKNEERKNMLKQERKKQDQLQTVAREKHEDLVRSARFEQIWKRRRVNAVKDHDLLHEICHLYDVVRVDGDEEMHERVQGTKDTPLEDDAILSSYLPLIREFLPTAAEEIESDLITSALKQDDYVYDIYTVENDLDRHDQVTPNDYPLVQVSDDAYYYDDPWQDEYESDDSNAENNPLNDYPDEEPSEEDEHESGDPSDYSSGSESEEEIVDIGEDDEEESSDDEDEGDTAYPDDYSESADSGYEMEIADGNTVETIPLLQNMI